MIGFFDLFLLAYVSESGPNSVVKEKMMEASRIRKGMVVECQQGVGTILVVDQEAETVLLAKQGSEEQLAVSFDEIEDNPQLHGSSDQYY
jgi:translation elongation factor P/translation initiation factor 5A